MDAFILNSIVDNLRSYFFAFIMFALLGNADVCAIAEELYISIVIDNVAYHRERHFLLWRMYLQFLRP